MAEIKFEIIKKIGIIGENARGWNKELNLISWNGREPKYDLRDWSPEHEKMGKGITLTNDELKSLKELLNDID
ncbi:MAG: PC4/YdbC family ssDNA-binding protein [Clostridiales bacterium]